MKMKKGQKRKGERVLIEMPLKRKVPLKVVNKIIRGELPDTAVFDYNKKKKRGKKEGS
jgi:hypothetical protein